MSGATQLKVCNQGAQSLKTLGQCLAEGLVSGSEVEAAASNFLANSDPIYVAPGIYAIMPTLEELPQKLRQTMIEIVLLGRV